MTPRFQAGGALAAGALYVQRRADSLLPQALLRGELCYVLAPRQMGKSSLRARTREALRKAGVATVSIDLTTIGIAESGGADFYFGLITEVAQQLDVTDPADFWRHHDGLSAVQRFVHYLRDVARELSGPLVVFVDEIDTLLLMPAAQRDDFFAALRALYNARADDPAFCRLTFCLLGVAMPQDLMSDPGRTPFNIGRGIPLNDFAWEEGAPFIESLAASSGNPERLLRAIFSWTSGHPYMTQRLCQAAVEERATGPSSEEARIDALVEQLFLRRGRVLDASLAATEKCFGREQEQRSQRTAAMLHLYERLRAGQRVPAQGHDPIQMELRLTGMAAEREDADGPFLVVRNRIFAAVFDPAWVGDKIAERRLSEPLSLWLASGGHDELLLDGSALHTALAWAERRDDLTDVEHRFLRKSLALSRAREQRQRRWLQLGLLPLALAAGAMAVAWHTAESNRRRSEVLAQIEIGLRATSLAQQPRREAAALQAGILAVAPALRRGLQVPQQAAAGLAAAVSRGRRSLLLHGLGSEAARLAFSPDGAHLAAGNGTALRIFAATTGRPLITVSGPGAEINDLVYSADGRHIAAASVDGTVQIFRAEDGTARTILRDPAYPLLTLDFDPEGKRLLVGSSRGDAAPLIRIFAVPSGQLLSTLPGPAAYLTAIVFSPDGQRIVATSSDGTAWLYDGTGKLLSVLRGHCELLLGARFSPDSARLVLTGFDGRAQLFDSASGLPGPVLSGHKAYVRAAFSPDSQLLATSGDEGTVILWDPRSATLLQTLRGHEAPIRAVSFSPDGRRVFTASRDGRARIYSARTGQHLATLHGHTSPLKGMAISAEGGRIATASTDGTIRLWSGTTGTWQAVLRGHSGAVSSVSFSPDDTRLITTSFDGNVHLWDAHTGQPLSILRGHTAIIHRARFSPDGQRIVTASGDHTARLWDLKSSQPALVLRGHSAEVQAASFSPDGSRVATASTDGTVRVHDVHSGAALLTLVGHRGLIISAVYSPDGQLLATAGSDGTARLWEAGSGRMLAVGADHGASLSQVLFSRDGGLLISIGDDRTARLFDVRSRRTTAILRGHTDEVWSAAVSPDGGRLLTTSKDGTARLWALPTGVPMAVLRGHTKLIDTGSFSPDGGRIVTTSWDQTARLWDGHSGQPLAVLSGHNQRLMDATFSPDGTRIATASEDQTARLWDGLTGRPLTPPASSDLLLPVEAEDADPESAPMLPIDRLPELLSSACQLLRYQPEYEAVAAQCGASLPE